MIYFFIFIDSLGKTGVFANHCWERWNCQNAKCFWVGGKALETQLPVLWPKIMTDQQDLNPLVGRHNPHLFGS